MDNWQQQEGLAMDDAGIVAATPVVEGQRENGRPSRRRKRGQQADDDVNKCQRIPASQGEETRQSVVCVSPVRRRPRTPWNADLTHRFMEELAILCRNRKLNTRKAATRKPVFKELARQINGQRWFPHARITSAQLLNKYDV
ncbi:hypothetical protein CSUB01_05055 [Colletotrichum sublineola]|uniref:Uncharacterized protein n=1 Tax=Colletotrichum sublineola TaxID=1173701 RepID=A0A066XS28_COLSU|nr:hypothetical protein CSUB01_05055 [Colletotrichum sublineola]